MTLNLKKKTIKNGWAESANNDHFLRPLFFEIPQLLTTIINENEKITINGESDEYRWFDLNDLPKRMIDKKEDMLKKLKRDRKQ